MANSHAQFMNETRICLQNQLAKIRNLEVKMGQITNIFSERQQGSLPCTFKVNPKTKGKECYKAITLRIGKTMEKLIEVDKTEKEEEKVENLIQGPVETN